MSLYSFIAGIGTAVAAFWLYAWSKERSLTLSWWQWLVVGAWALFLFFTDIFIFTGLGEDEPRAALMGGAFMIAVAVILGVGIWRWFFIIPRAKADDSCSKV